MALPWLSLGDITALGAVGTLCTIPCSSTVGPPVGTGTIEGVSGRGASGSFGGVRLGRPAIPI